MVAILLSFMTANQEGMYNYSVCKTNKKADHFEGDGNILL